MAAVAATLLAPSCARKTGVEVVEEPSTAVVVGYPVGGEVLTGSPRHALPKATAFRMSGDYANHVAVTLSPQGELVYFPAVSDITAASKPLKIGDGWWLNRQGLSAGSVFLKYTFEEYAALPKTPSPKEIKAAVIPGATVTAFEQLPVSMQEAAANPTSLLQYIRVQPVMPMPE